MMASSRLAMFVCIMSFTFYGTNASAQFGGFNPGKVLKGVPGGVGGGLAKKFIAIAMSQMLRKLSNAEKVKRRRSLRAAAKSGRSRWTSGGSSGKKATYRRTASIQKPSGQKCHKVKETITLKSGKRATATETVCFN